MIPLRPVAVATAAAITLTGCSLPFAGDGDDASSPPSSSSAGPDPTPTEDLGRAGRQLTDQEVEQALPTTPDGYTRDEQPRSTQRRTDPETCLDLLRLGWQGRNANQKRTARADGHWYTNGNDVETYHAYSATVATHSEAVSPHLLRRAGEALGQCDSFSLTGVTSGASFDDRVLTESIQVRNIGEQTFAVRLISFVQVNGKTHRLYLDTLDFRVGHNLVSVQSVSYQEDHDPDRLETMAQRILDDLKK